MRFAMFGACGLVAAGLVGCGPNFAAHESPTADVTSDVSDLPCLVRPASFPGAAEMPTTMIRAERLLAGDSNAYMSPTNPYPDYKGFGEAIYVWTGLVSGPAAAFDPPKTGGGTGNQAPDSNLVDDLPNSGPLFTEYPTQIFDVSIEVDDYGTVPAAKSWLAESRQSYPVNDIPIEASGLTTHPSVPSMGDDTFVMQLDRSSPGGPAAAAYTGPFVGDVYTDIEVREGVYVYSVGIDAAPRADAVSAATVLVQRMMSNQEAACDSSASGASSS